jgi:hypothetical protein
MLLNAQSLIPENADFVKPYQVNTYSSLRSLSSHNMSFRLRLPNHFHGLRDQSFSQAHPYLGTQLFSLPAEKSYHLLTYDRSIPEASLQ